jgi:hypothetical protein
MKRLRSPSSVSVLDAVARDKRTGFETAVQTRRLDVAALRGAVLLVETADLRVLERDRGQRCERQHAEHALEVAVIVAA